MRIEIKKLGINGEGIGYVNDKICFIDNVLPGEVVDGDIVQTKSKYLRARVNTILQSSPDRVEPMCQYYGKCGGCDLQHMSMPQQLNFKTSKIKDTLHKIAHIDVEVLDTIHLNDFNYRNKMVFPISMSDGEIRIGMFLPNSHEVVDIDKCMLADRKINDVLSIFHRYCMNDNVDISKYKYLVVRTNGKGVLATIVSTEKVDLKGLFDILNSTYSECGVSNLVSSSDVEILDGKYYHEYGIETLEYQWEDIKYRVNNLGFLQVNNDVKDYLYRMVESTIRPDSIVLDAYCGAGLMTAICAGKARHAIGLEINKSAIESANKLVLDNGITNVEFHRCDVKDEIGKYLAQYTDITLILDPPRAGCSDAVLSAIVASNNIHDIIYISCDPATLARDLNVLKVKYNIKKVQPLDMFPQTKHVETVCLLTRK